MASGTLGTGTLSFTRAVVVATCSVVVPAGGTYAFKYLSDGGTWFNDVDADQHSTNEYGEVNSLIIT